MKPPPFKIFRTCGNHLPVYKKLEKNRSIAFTIVNKLQGDVEPLKKDLQFITNQRCQSLPGGKIKLSGDHRIIIKQYLEGLGF